MYVADSLKGQRKYFIYDKQLCILVRVSSLLPHIFCHIFGAGECFGICNLLVAEPLQTVLRCAEETTVRFWEKEALVAAMRGDAALAMAYAALCNAKIQFLLSRIEMLTMQSCRGKVLAFLLAEKREDGVILLRGTRDELASRLSVSRAALYRELSALQSGGYLEVGESRLRVLNTSALEKLLYGV